MDSISRSRRSAVMRAVRGRDTKLEIVFRKALWRAGFRYRKNPRGFFGNPDLANSSKRVVVFIDSCFWHGCGRHCRMPASNRKYWNEKIRRNQTRDRKVNRYYKNIGWRVERFWEHQIKAISDISNLPPSDGAL